MSAEIEKSDEAKLKSYEDKNKNSTATKTSVNAHTSDAHATHTPPPIGVHQGSHPVEVNTPPAHHAAAVHPTPHATPAATPHATPAPAAPSAQSCSINEALSAFGPNQCDGDSQCQGNRHCSSFGYCAGHSDCQSSNASTSTSTSQSSSQPFSQQFGSIDSTQQSQLNNGFYQGSGFDNNGGAFTQPAGFPAFPRFPNANIQ